MTMQSAFRISFFIATLGLGSLLDASEPHPQETAAIQHVQAAEDAMKHERFTDAVKALEKAVALVPDSASYHMQLSNAYVAAERYKLAWLSLRKAAALAPSDQQIVNRFSRFWSIFDRQQGLFNVGQPIDTIVNALGKPDKQIQGRERVRYVYGFYALDTKDDRLHELLDLRGMKPEHLSPTEIVTVNLDGRGWRINYRVNTRISATAEYVLPNEQIQDWSELVSIQRLHSLAASGQSLEQFVTGMMTNLKKSNPDRQYRILDKDENSILYEWRTGGTEQHDAQHEIARLLRGPRDIHRLAYVKKCPELSAADLEIWANILKSAQLKSVASPHQKPEAEAEPTTPSPSAATRARVWKFGGRLSSAAVMHAAGAAPEQVKATFAKASADASQLGIALDSLPETTEDHIDNSLKVSVYLMKESGRRIHRELTANYDRSHAALLELAIKSNMLHLLYVPNDSTGKALAGSIQDRIGDAKLPEMIFEPLLTNIERGAERKLIVRNCLKLHTDIQLLLEKEAKASQTNRPTASDQADLIRQLQGAWKLIRATGNNEDDLPIVGEAIVLFDQDQVSFIAKNQETIQATYQIQTSASPMRIIWSFDTEEDGESEQLAEIFKLEGDTVVFCGDSDKQVPTEFDVPPGSARVLTVYERVRG